MQKPFYLGRAVAEAKICIGLVKRGVDTVERVRRLIAVSEKEETELRNILLQPGFAAHFVHERREVLFHFDRFIAQIEHTRPPKSRRLSRNVRKCPVSNLRQHSVSASL
jgi:hypothetical protein